MASASGDHTVHVWEAVPDHPWLKAISYLTSFRYLTYAGHSKAVYAVTWSPDGEHIASGGIDAVLHIWAVDTGKTIFLYHNATVVKAVS